MFSKYGNCTRLLKIKNKLKIKAGKNSRYFVGVFNKTIIALALVGYEMIIANATRGIIGPLHDDVILLLRQESLRTLVSCAN